jgi:Holliday junction DNA helicase RuvB
MDENKPINEASPIGPQVIEQFTGQKTACELIKIALEASWASNSIFPSTLFYGPPGVGKSALSALIAKEIAGNFHETLAQNITSIEQMRGLLMEPSDGDVLFLDEIHQIKPDLQVTLYRAMENRQIFMDKGKSQSRSMTIANYTIIGATTDEYRLLKPLRDRFKLILPLSFYSDEDLSAVIKQRAKQLGWAVEDDAVIDQIAKRGRGTPRIALKILESAKRYACSQGEKLITIDHLNGICTLEGLDNQFGLGPNERKLLKILSEIQEPLRLNVIAAHMGLPSRTISENIEDFLIRKGLITRTDKGRMITPQGLEYLKQNP